MLQNTFKNSRMKLQYGCVSCKALFKKKRQLKKHSCDSSLAIPKTENEMENEGDKLNFNNDEKQSSETISVKILFSYLILDLARLMKVSGNH